MDNNALYLETIEKSMCRLFVYGDGKKGQTDLILLPWCIDKWRKFVRERKAFKYWIIFFEHREQPVKWQKKCAFFQWAAAVHGRKKDLSHWQFPWLKTEDYYNRRFIKNKIDTIHDTQNKINDLRN